MPTSITQTPMFKHGLSLKKHEAHPNTNGLDAQGVRREAKAHASRTQGPFYLKKASKLIPCLIYDDVVK